MIQRIPPASAGNTVPNSEGVSEPSNVLLALETRTLGSQESPPSSEAVKRTWYPTLLLSSRRSYHITPTTPSRLTAMVGVQWSGPSRFSLALSSLTARGRDQVLPPSAEYDTRISDLPERESAQARYTRSLNALPDKSTANPGTVLRLFWKTAYVSAILVGLLSVRPPSVE